MEEVHREFVDITVSGEVVEITERGEVVEIAAPRNLEPGNQVQGI